MGHSSPCRVIFTNTDHFPWNSRVPASSVPSYLPPWKSTKLLSLTGLWPDLTCCTITFPVFIYLLQHNFQISPLSLQIGYKTNKHTYTQINEEITFGYNEFQSKLTLTQTSRASCWHCQGKKTLSVESRCLISNPCTFSQVPVRCQLMHLLLWALRSSGETGVPFLLVCLFSRERQNWLISITKQFQLSWTAFSKDSHCFTWHLYFVSPNSMLNYIFPLKME